MVRTRQPNPYDRGQDPHVETDEDSDDDKDKEEIPVDQNAKDKLHQCTIKTLANLISISPGAATALYDDQNIVGLHSFRPLKDSYV